MKRQANILMLGGAKRVSLARLLIEAGKRMGIEVNIFSSEIIKEVPIACVGTVVEGIVQKRLMLPAGTPYIDVVSGLNDKEVVEAVVIIDDVYPRMTGTMTSIKTVQRTTEAAEGEDPETFTAYQFKDSSLTFSKEYILPGETLRIQFQSGPLSGMEFDVTFNPDKIEDESKPEAQVFEIVRNDDYGQYLPQIPLIPGVGNQYILYNFDTQYVSDELIPEAEQELLEKALALKDKMVADPSTYNCVLNSYRASGYDENNGTLNPSKAIDLTAGQKVNLINKAYFKNGRVTRIIGFEKKLDIPYDSPSYTAGETAAYSRLGELEQRIESIQVEGNTYVNQGGVGGFGVYIIKKEDTTAASDSNVFSALRTLAEIDKVKEEIDEMYLRKDINDTAHGIILFDQKIGSSVFVDGWEGKGWEIRPDGGAWLGSANVRDSLFVGNRMGSPLFVSGFPNGVGWDLSPYKQLNAAGAEETKWRLEIDDINVRGRLRVYEFIISQLRGENDNLIFAGMMKVDHYDEATRRIYLDTDEGVLYNPFRPGDILMVQRYGGMPTEENDYNVIKQYELRVDQAEVGDLSEGEKRLDWITFTNFVGTLSDIARGDVLTRVDSVTDLTRKGIVKVTTIDEIGAPYIDVVYGMKTDPENATKARMGNLTGIRTKSGIDLTGIWGIYGNGAYFENSTYILDDGNTIEQKFSIMNGEFNSYIKDIRNNMALEPGNILRNSSFSDNLDYWVTADSINFWGLDSEFVYANGDFVSEKSVVADIITDGGRSVLRLRASGVTQRNQVMNFQPHEETGESKYSFAIFCKAITAGTLSVGIEGTEELYLEQELSPATEYQRISKVGTWDEHGDFVISFTGEIYVYGASLFYDEIANATIELSTQIQQTAEQIKLMATKEYVDSATGAVMTSVEAELSVMAGEIALRATQEDIDTATGAVKNELEGKITVQAGRIDGVATDIDNINNTIETAGWITKADGNTLYASKSLENGNKIISYINQTATTTTINSSRINLKGAVTYTDLDTDLQDSIDAAGGDALDKAIDAFNKASEAYDLANSANNNASDASSTASDAYSRASTAITNAANALSAANAAQTSVDNLPGWSKEKDIITALEDATVIVNGYISTSMIDVDNIYATKLKATEGSIGAFKITNFKSLETTDTSALIRFMGASNNFILMTLASGGPYFQVNSTTGTAISAVSTGGTALYCSGIVKMKGLSSLSSASGRKPLYVNPNTGEIAYLN